MGENLSPGASSIKPLLLSSPQTPPGALPTSTLCLSLSFSPSPSHMFHASSFSFLVPCTRVHTGLRQTQCGLPQAPSRPAGSLAPPGTQPVFTELKRFSENFPPLVLSHNETHGRFQCASFVWCMQGPLKEPSRPGLWL